MLRGLVPVSFRRYSGPFQSPISLIVGPVSTPQSHVIQPHTVSFRQIKPSVVCRSTVQLHSRGLVSDNSWLFTAFGVFSRHTSAKAVRRLILKLYFEPFGVFSSHNLWGPDRRG